MSNLVGREATKNTFLSFRYGQNRPERDNKCYL